MILKQFIFILICGFVFFNPTIQSCEKGCLLCRDEVCVICDSSNNYYKVGDICTKKNLENCKLSFDGEKCQECEPGYYIDFQTSKCVSFGNTTPAITNCLTFKYEKDCVSCKEGFYLNEGNCSTIDTIIPFCSQYSDPKTCSKCDQKVLKEDGKECLDFEDPNCMAVTTIECVQCIDNYILYDNKYLYDFNTWTVNKLKKYDISNIVNPYYSKCVQLDVDNCMVYETFNTCKTCNDGYFKNPEGTCTILPEEPIQNCFEYKTQGVCIQCLEGFYLKSEFECEPHGVSVTLCEKMSMTVKDVCDSCAEGYFLDSNSCVQRQITIDKCKELNAKGDNCQTCEDGNILNDTNTLCLPEIENCIEYVRLPTSLTCTDCETGYYYHQEGRCAKVARPIDGCLNYKSNQDFVADDDGKTYHCVKCLDKYYMSSPGVCTPHTTEIVDAINCGVFSQTQQDVCESCNEAQVKFQAMNYCTPVSEANKDANCLIYNESGEREVCVDGYFQVDNKCLKITIANCTQAIEDGQRCSQCQANELKNFHISFESENNICSFSYEYVIHDCETTDSILTNVTTSSNYNTNICPVCISPYYPASFDTEVKFCVPKSDINFNYGNPKHNDNCNIFEPIEDKCYECSFNSILVKKKVIDNEFCLDDCNVEYTVSNELIPKVIKIREGKQFFKCSTDVKVTDCNIESNDKCYECNAGFLPVVIGGDQISTNTNFATFETYDYIPCFYGDHFKTKSLSFSDETNKIALFDSCREVKPTNTLNHDPEITNNSGTYPFYMRAADYTSTSDLLKRCRFLLSTEIAGQNYYGCGACKWGTSGYYVPSPNGEQSIFFISECNILNVCDLGVFYEGLGNNNNDAHLNAWVSCHKCSDDSKIVTFHRGKRIGATNGGTPDFPTKNFYQQTDCVKPGYVENSSGFPNNCAVQEVLPAISLKEYDLNDMVDINPFCAACKPGYKPIMQDGFIINCEEIVGCDKTLGLSIFNKCDLCVDGMVLNANKDACLPNTILNCYIGLDETDQRICNICKDNYVPTPNKQVCNRVIFNNCLNVSKMSLTDNDLPYTGPGCIECELGYLAFAANLTQTVCIKSDEIENRVYTNAGIENCLTYTSQTDCNECTVGFIKPVDSNLTCVLSSTVTNCDAYDVNKKCKKCKSGFLLNGNECLDGADYISNCSEFTSETECDVCYEGFAPVRIDGKILCYGVSDSLPNCLEYDKTLSLEQKIKCTQCKPLYYPKAPEEGKTINSCVSIPFIENCSEYDMDNFKCVKCNEGYYIKNPIVSSKLQKCLKREANSFACFEFEIYSDSCKQCFPGYYVRNSECEFKPTGVIGCAVYLDEINCAKCKNKQYLLGNTCRPVPENNYIEKCLYYQDETICSDCEPGYWLRDNQCFAILISNCDLLESENKCKICQDQYFLTNISTCQKGQVDNCLIHSSQTTCQLCAQNYFVNQNLTCEQIQDNQRISDCLYYSTPTLCKQCTNNAILNKDRKSCLTIDKLESDDPLTDEIESNCDAYEYSLKCKVCNPGFYFVENKCEPCDSSFNGSCQLCDPIDRTKCHICKPGYFMDNQGNCNLDQTLVEETDDHDHEDNGSDDGDDGDGSENSNKSGFVLRVNSVLLLAYLILS